MSPSTLSIPSNASTLSPTPPYHLSTPGEFILSSSSQNLQITHLTHTESFVCGGLAACGAVTVTNPMEVAKTRMQLQGELSRGGPKVYHNSFDVLRKAWRFEGIGGIQRGLGSAVSYFFP
jgi:solute carrier family 25, member 34/35